jgi:pimeloyl-ACP methyl ester carboxylesterase
MVMKKILKWTGIVVLALLILYFVGPRADKVVLSPEMPKVSNDLIQLEKDIEQSEAKFDLKPDNQARIVWADSTKKQKTKYSIVYIHGFGASWAEGDPVHREIAKRYGCNLYLARLHDAGLRDREAFDDLTPENFWAGAKQALAVGQQLGDSVIVMGCSAGGMLTVALASQHPEIKAIMLYSPCMSIYKNALGAATGPWGRQILNVINGTARDITTYKPDRAKYWLTRYRSEGLVTLQQMMDVVAQPNIYAKITVPIWLGYYYKDEENQDKVVSVEAMLDMFDKVSTAANKKQKVAFPESGDHVIASHFTSKDITGVLRESDNFIANMLGLQAVKEQKNNKP